MRYLVILLGFLVSTATPLQAKEWRAPAQWRDKWTGEIVVTYVPIEQVRAACDALARKANWIYAFQRVPPAYGCIAPNRKKTDKVCRIIVVNKTMDGYSPREIMLHEMDHCTGWPTSHPAN